MIEIWTDGSCEVHTTQNGGWAFITSDGGEYGGYLRSTTNNRAELTAVLKALEWCLNRKTTAIIYCDSQYVVNSLTKWGKKWQSSGWKKAIANKDIFTVLYPLYVESGCEIRWIRGHNGNEGNEAADRLAVHCMKNQLTVSNN